MKFLNAFAAAAALASAGVSALPKVTRSGRYLYQEGGTRFYVKGIAYQEQGTVSTNDPTGFPEPTDYVDPLADATACNRDVPYLKQLGVNTVRVYSVNSGLNHDACMQALSGAGIYVILDLALPVNGSIDRASPAWTTNLLNQYIGTVDAFSKYDNVLAYNIGNEVVTGPPDTISAPFIKAAARDVKAYLKSKGSSALISYSSTDGDTWRQVLSEYLACDTEATSIDLYGLNIYRWCGNGSLTNYNGLLTDYQNYPIPMYFAEFGCITSPPRLWTEVAAIYGTQMSPVLSGGVAFSYFPAVGGYGMVTISGSTVTTTDDFNRLQQQYNQVQFINSPAQGSTNTQTTCPAPSTAFLASTTLPPTPVDTACECLKKNVFSCAFTNTAASNTAPIIGELLNYSCSELGKLSGSCNPIGANGQTGVYGPFSVCDPVTKLSYALSEYYELSGRQATSCSFSGNATLVSTGPASAQAASAAESACASSAPTGTQVPAQPAATAPSTKGASNPATTNGSNSNGSNNNNNSAGALSVKGSMVTMIAGVVGLAGAMALLM